MILDDRAAYRQERPSRFPRARESTLALGNLASGDFGPIDAAGDVGQRRHRPLPHLRTASRSSNHSTRAKGAIPKHKRVSR